MSWQTEAYIITYSGQRFYPLAPRVEDVRIEDIAHALSNQCRFTGHVKRFYSVSQHAWHVSHKCNPADALWGLLHDASEAYIADLSAPLKHSPEMANYVEIERQLMAVICERFSLDPQEPESVRVADRRMLNTEGLQLMRGYTVKDGYAEYEPYAFEIDPLPPLEAEHQFLDRFQYLRGLDAIHARSLVCKHPDCWICRGRRVVSSEY